MNAARTLLLNSTYEPLLVISWQRATTMVYLGKVEVLRSYDSWLRSVSTEPRMIRMKVAREQQQTDQAPSGSASSFASFR